MEAGDMMGALATYESVSMVGSLYRPDQFFY